MCGAVPVGNDDRDHARDGCPAAGCNQRAARPAGCKLRMGKRKSLAVFNGGSHSMFTDRTNTGGAILNYKVKEATQELSIDFMGQVLGNRESTLQDWSERYESILSKVIN